MTFLKKQTVDVDGQSVEITQLSGLERFDYLEYCADLPQPDEVAPMGENPSEEQKKQYAQAIAKAHRTWTKLTFLFHSRLVAYGLKGEATDIEQQHQVVMSTMTPDQIKHLHDEIARFSGMPLLNDEQNESSEESTIETSSEPIDPKA
ncbi:phage minor tail protein domain-containing protein [Photobacterium atrarenae]|uniref:Tail assembly protein G domain-containing protein n=1 Tax=Photobacterium atrarenae TaxID=865757 RepID=A0ABY5GI83_9GAMM|nr:phage minor tail protein G [Photobacterium atrarenae]UTV29000.1 hypothetical protein NNL38_07155 [Photobacterium atrarenae]